MSRNVAIIGASANRAKFGNKSVRAHARAGWTVYPVNPRASAIEGFKASSSMAEVPVKVDRVTLYVPAAMGVTLLDDIARCEPGEVFLNPGSDGDEVEERAKALGLNVVTGCSIVDVGYTPADFPD